MCALQHIGDTMYAAKSLLRAASGTQKSLHLSLTEFQQCGRYTVPPGLAQRAAESAAVHFGLRQLSGIAAHQIVAASTAAAAAGRSAASGSLVGSSLRQGVGSVSGRSVGGGSLSARWRHGQAAQMAALVSISHSVGTHVATWPAAARCASGWAAAAARQAAATFKPAARMLGCELRAVFRPGDPLAASQAAAGSAAAAGKVVTRQLSRPPAAAAVVNAAGRQAGQRLPAAAGAAARQQAREFNGYSRSYASPYASVTLNRSIDPMHLLYGLIGELVKRELCSNVDCSTLLYMKLVLVAGCEA